MDIKLQEILPLLADTILPLNTWLQQPERANIVTPWRETESTTITANSLSLISFIEQLISESGVDEDLAKRWDEVEKNPLAVFLVLPKHDNEWRRSRGLEEKAVFGIVESENIEVTLDNPEQASSRRIFYDYSFQLLLKALPDQLPLDLQAFVIDLLTDKVPKWLPDKSVVKSSHFIKQFTKDLFYALMGMKIQPPQLESLAVLVEAGESRRVGNSYSVENVRAAVAVFDAKLKKFDV
jgi:hypothetical protein